jgi:hypothetical protein
MDWNNSHKNPPKEGQEVYYFGPNIGLHIGKYTYRDEIPTVIEEDENGNNVKRLAPELEGKLCPHVFLNNNWGTCDACDAPFWLPYDPERAKSWCPVIPKKYTKGLYDDDEE